MIKKRKTPRFGQLSDATQAAFVALKEKLASPPLLDFPRHCRPYVLDTDACESQVGCGLMQADDDKPLRRVGYWRKTLCHVERNYNTIERECLPIVWAVLLLWIYSKHARFLIRSNYSALCWVLNFTTETDRLAR